MYKLQSHCASRCHVCNVDVLAHLIVGLKKEQAESLVGR